MAVHDWESTPEGDAMRLQMEAMRQEFEERLAAVEERNSVLTEQLFRHEEALTERGWNAYTGDWPTAT